MFVAELKALTRWLFWLECPPFSGCQHQTASHLGGDAFTSWRRPDITQSFCSALCSPHRSEIIPPSKDKPVENHWFITEHVFIFKNCNSVTALIRCQTEQILASTTHRIIFFNKCRLTIANLLFVVAEQQVIRYSENVKLKHLIPIKLIIIIWDCRILCNSQSTGLTGCFRLCAGPARLVQTKLYTHTHSIPVRPNKTKPHPGPNLNPETSLSSLKKWKWGQHTPASPQTEHAVTSL